MQQPRRFSKPWLPLTIFVGVILLGGLLSQVLERSPARTERQRADQAAHQAVTALEAELWRSLAAADTLAALWTQQPERLPDLARYRPIFQERYPAARGARLFANDGTAPAIANDPVAARQLAALSPDAIQSPHLTLEVVLLNGQDYALLVQQPVSLTADATVSPLGAVVVLLSLPELLAASGLEALTAAGYHYELSLQFDRVAGLVVARSGAPLTQPLSVPLRVADQSWTLAIAPIGGWQHRPIATLGQLLLILAMALLATFVAFIIKRPERLQQQVDERIRTLSVTNEDLTSKLNQQQQANAALTQALAAERTAHQASAQELETVQRLLRARQAQLIQNESLASLGRLAAGIAHEIASPTNFIHGNLDHANRYALDLLHLVDRYQERYPEVDAELQAELNAIDLTFVRSDLPSLLKSMQVSTRRIREIIRSLRSFSLDDVAMKTTDLHTSIERALLILQSRLRGKAGQPDITIQRQYGKLPPLVCCPGQIDQVIVNLLTNAIDALATVTERQITIQTALTAAGWVEIRIRDTGPGIPRELQSRLFEPFFTTKPVGQGTGLGLAVCQQIIVERHQGRLTCTSEPGVGTEFVIAIPAQPQMLTAETSQPTD
ncbi:MAG: HAMP domain-containing histidine kinase [Spirulinaceae cyanobacterium SM2_1_0]|nr:HAMP domain-containing histidine kinase [Spirulinaceae cyanobacterium SM2_1_0]